MTKLRFSRDTWRRTLYVLFALPVSVACVPLALLGGYRVAARLQRGLAGRYLAPRTDQPASRARAGRVLAHSLLSLPLELVSLALIAYLWIGVAVNLGYPLRPGTMESYQHSWGGPSLAGAWSVHAASGLVFLLLTPWVVRAATWMQGGLCRRLLGAG